MRPQAGRLRPGTVLGGYRLLEPLGEGGMGVVYRAVQLSLEREVALKVLSPGVSGDPEHRRRFLQEGLLAAKAAHPRLVHVLEAGESGQQVFIAYELMRGRTLRGELATVGRLSPEAAAEVAGACAEALSALHGLGILHRDVKPENVFLEPGRGALLGDLGIAKDLGGAGIQTSQGIILGTPGYIAPELILGKSASAASDLYALGIVLFECLAGRLPFDSQDPQELLRSHLSEPPPPLSGMRPELPAKLSALVAAALAKDPARRPVDAAAFLVQLRAAAAAPARAPSGVTIAMSTGRARRAPTARTLVSEPRPVRRSARRWPLVAGAAVLAALVGGVLLRPAERPSSPPDPIPAATAGSSPAPATAGLPTPAVSSESILTAARDRLVALRWPLEESGKYFQAISAGKSAPVPPGVSATPGPDRPGEIPRAAIRRSLEFLGTAMGCVGDAFRRIEPVANPNNAELARACGFTMLQIFALYDLARGCLWPVFAQALERQKASGMLHNILGPDTMMKEFEVGVADLAVGLQQSIPPALKQTGDPYYLAGLAVLKGLVRQRARTGSDSERLSAEVAELAGRALPGLARPGGQAPEAVGLVDVLLTSLRLSGVGPLRLKLVKQALAPYEDPELDARLGPHDELIRCRLACELLLLQYRNVDLYLETQARLQLQYEKWHELYVRFLARWPCDPRKPPPATVPAGPAGDRLREAILHQANAHVCFNDIKGNLERISDLLQDPSKLPPR